MFSISSFSHWRYDIWRSSIRRWQRIVPSPPHVCFDIQGTIQSPRMACLVMMLILCALFPATYCVYTLIFRRNDCSNLQLEMGRVFPSGPIAVVSRVRNWILLQIASKRPINNPQVPAYRGFKRMTFSVDVSPPDTKAPENLNSRVFWRGGEGGGGEGGELGRLLGTKVKCLLDMTNFQSQCASK